MKKFLLCCVMMYCCYMLHGQVTNGLVAYYPFNGNANDASGHNHNGTVYNATLATDRYDIANSAYNFNGANTRIEIGDHPDFHVSNLSVSAWLNLNVTNAEPFQSFVSKSVGAGTFNSYVTYYDNGASRLGGFVSSGGFDENVTVPYALSGQWFHYVFTYEDVSNTMKIYANGSLIATGSTSVTLGYDNSPLTIGCEYQDNQLMFFVNCKIDDVGIYNRVLTQAEIDTLANPIPYASITDKAIAEGNDGTSLMKLKVFLNHAYNNVVKIKYTTADSTAASGTDYVAKQGIISFQLGQVSKTISIPVNGDVTRERNEVFKVILGMPLNAIFADSLGVGIIRNDDAALVTTSSADELSTSIPVNIFPNPAKDIINVTGLGNNATIEILDVYGKPLLRKKAEQFKTSIDISALAPGNYLIKYFSSGSEKTVRFIKL